MFRVCRTNVLWPSYLGRGPFCVQPGVTELTFAGPLDMMPPRWRALATMDLRRKTPCDVSYGNMVKQLVADCSLELANRMARAKRACVFFVYVRA